MATKLHEVYRCRICGNIVEVIHHNAGELICCNQLMQLQTENTVDASQEKHVPTIEMVDKKITVKVGSEPHPMDDDHYIEWVEVINTTGQVYRQYLRPGDDPLAEFDLLRGEVSEVRAYCNLHGLWSSK
jgi:superoxide reductase